MTGQREVEFVLVPKVATAEMIEAAWAQALDENAAGVWEAMIEFLERTKGLGNGPKGEGSRPSVSTQ